ncbi:MAG TPA: catalase-related domain-containing protein, partial [Thermoanaerobaculia bacterium]|nr:catalase-related domain-containing protein [Thermoanaerobaculia bacterium]
EDDKVRGKPEKFADHYTQATLFWNSQTPIEKAHIVRGFRFELTKVQVPAVRERVVAMLANVDEILAEAVAEGLGIPVPEPLPKALDLLDLEIEPEMTTSPALSLFARPGEAGVGTRKIALLVADGAEGADLQTLHRGLSELGAVPRYVGARLGGVATGEGGRLEVEVTLETTPSVLYDAVVVPGGEDAAAALTRNGQALEFLKDQYRHCKPMLVIGAGANVLEEAGLSATLPSGDPDPGLLLRPDGLGEDGLALFVSAVAKHRHFDRAMDPPRV